MRALLVATVLVCAVVSLTGKASIAKGGAVLLGITSLYILTLSGVAL